MKNSSFTMQKGRRKMRTLDNRIILLKSLVGSHNYGLNTETSDKDYKFFVTPTFDDLYSGTQHSGQVITEDTDYVVHDIRKLPEQLFKANINYLEVLDSNQTYIASHEMSDIFSVKEHIFKMNLPALYRACNGMFKNKMSLLRKGTEGTQHLVDEFGYDTKQALHAFRQLKFIVDFEATEFEDFHSALRYSGDDLDFMMSIRNGFFEQEVFENFIEHYYESTFLKLQDRYINQPVNAVLKTEIDELVKEAVHKNLK